MNEFNVAVFQIKAGKRIAGTVYTRQNVASTQVSADGCIVPANLINKNEPIALTDLGKQLLALYVSGEDSQFNAKLDAALMKKLEQCSNSGLVTSPQRNKWLDAKAKERAKERKQKARKAKASKASKSKSRKAADSDSDDDSSDYSSDEDEVEVTPTKTKKTASSGKKKTGGSFKNFSTQQLEDLLVASPDSSSVRYRLIEKEYKSRPDAVAF